MSDLFKLPNFRNLDLFQQAMTHRSYLNEFADAQQHNERLEFLGDAVLNFLSGEYLYKKFASKSEGELTPLRSALVDEQQLAQFALYLRLDQHLKLGRGAEKDGGRQNANLLSSAFEAMIGAYFLDTGSDINLVRAYVEPMFAAVIDTLLLTASTVNFKSRLQQWALAHQRENPQYIITGQTGPDHAREFTADVYVAGKKYGTGQGRRKQDAEKNAAKDALQGLGLI